MRLFVAIDLAGRVRRGLGSFAADLAGRLAAARLVPRGTATWVAEQNLHLTLRFVGEVDGDAGERMASSLGQPFDVAPFDVSLAGLGVFPPGGPPRVLWIGVTTGGDGLAALARAVEDRLVGLGVEPDQKPFSGHLTLARFKRPPERGLRDALASLAPPGPFGPCPVDHVTLYASVLTPSGPTYRSLARGPLAVQRTGARTGQP